MGCGASKASAQVVPTTQPIPVSDTKKENVIEHTPQSTTAPTQTQHAVPPSTIEPVPTPPEDTTKVTATVSDDGREKRPVSAEQRQEEKEKGLKAGMHRSIRKGESHSL